MNQFSISQQQLDSSPARSIVFVAYPGIVTLDLTGPMEVFAFANLLLQMEGLSSEPVYQVEVLTKDGKPISTLSGLQIFPTTSFEKVDGHLDTLIVPGGTDPETAEKDTELVEWIYCLSKNTRRLASVCTGAFILAKSGLLDGHMVTTHWNFTRQFKELYPAVRLVPDRIFVCDGSIWSSGGVTSGIDLALALIEEDWSHKLALNIARFLVVFLKRPGGQSQYSSYLTTGVANGSKFSDLQAWIMENPGADLKVDALAKQIAMSTRNFARLFLLETGVTPAKYVEMVRTDLVRHYLQNTEMQIAEIAQKSGFRDPETMRRTFVRHVGINPVDYRARFGSRSDSTKSE